MYHHPGRGTMAKKHVLARNPVLKRVRELDWEKLRVETRDEVDALEDELAQFGLHLQNGPIDRIGQDLLEIRATEAALDIRLRELWRRVAERV